MPSTLAVYYRDAQRIFDDIDAQFQLTPDFLVDLTKAFLKDFKLGLENYDRPVAMIPTYVTSIPDGSETGTFLALDLGGTNLRVCEVNLKGDKTFTIRQQKYKVSEVLKTGESSALFDYLADSVDAFLTSHASDSEASALDVVHLGLTFSFPVEQTALNKGKILSWTKGFSARNAVGRDVVQLLQDAFDRKHMHVKCVALVNDTVGALLSRAYTSGGCILGAIFGTGTNGAYVEQVANITKLDKKSEAFTRGGHMVINTEWGAFDDAREHLPTTPYDNRLDRKSINPRLHAYEKFISGMYLGEITRHMLMSLVDAAPRSLLFGGKVTTSVNGQWGFDTSVMSEVEEAWRGPVDDPTYQTDIKKIPVFKDFDENRLVPEVKTRLERVRRVVIDSLGYDHGDISLKDAAIVRWACTLVARRAALLSGAAVAAVLVQTGRATLPGEKPTNGFANGHTEKEIEINIGVDGSLIQHYPNFEHTMREALILLVGEEVNKKVVIGMAKDGSAIGAALCALEAMKTLKTSTSTHR